MNGVWSPICSRRTSKCAWPFCRKRRRSWASTLPEDVINFLANRIRTNIRRLEGALIRVASYASLTGKKLTIEVVEGLLREILHEEGRFTISIEVIQKKVAEHFDIRLADMTSKRRPLGYWCPRQLRYDFKWNRNKLTKGCDVIGFKFAQDGAVSPQDELFVFEAKAQLAAGTPPQNRLQIAIDDFEQG